MSRSRAKIGQIRPKVAECRPVLATIATKLTKSSKNGQTSSEIGGIRDRIDQHRPNLRGGGKFRSTRNPETTPKLAKIAPKLVDVAEMNEFRTMFGR